MLRERKCPVCNKSFIVMSALNWTYKHRFHNKGSHTYYCSYSCMVEGTKDIKYKIKLK